MIEIYQSEAIKGALDIAIKVELDIIRMFST